MAAPGVTLLVEELQRLAAALPPDARFPALERVLARGRPRRLAADSPNHLRFFLFGAEPGGHLPVAALTRVAGAGTKSDSKAYWMRADPVSLSADMTRVFMTACGFAGYDEAERNAVTRIVAGVLAYEGIALPEPVSGCWCFPLNEALPFEFTPLHAALGVDLAEVLPSHPDAANWKRILTEIQVELHQSELNGRRRDAGLPLVNSVWFWGGGQLPAEVEPRFDAVCSDDPVSRGMALQSGCRTQAPDADGRDAERLLIDWTLESADAMREAAALDAKVARLLSAVGTRPLLLLDGSGLAWHYDRRAARRFWLRTRPLANSFEERGRAD